MTVEMKVAAGVTQIYGLSGTLYTPDANGILNVQPGDISSIINSGEAFPAVARNHLHNITTAPAAASAALVLASGALSNGTKAVAAQPDTPRQLQYVVAPGSAAITGGTLTVAYWGNDGIEHTEVFSLQTAASTNLTIKSTFGCSLLVSQVVAGLAGGSSPGLEGGTNATLALPIDAGESAVSVYRENVDGTSETVGTVGALTGLITTTTAPNGTHTFSFGYTGLIAPPAAITG